MNILNYSNLAFLSNQSKRIVRWVSGTENNLHPTRQRGFAKEKYCKGFKNYGNVYNSGNAENKVVYDL